MSEIVIRPFSSDDNLLCISRLYAECWREAYADILDPDYLTAIPEDQWVQCLREKRMIWLAFSDEELIGISTCAAAREERYAGWGELMSLYLRSAFWRQGIGRQLMQKALASLWELECRDVYLWVLVDNNRARHFYEKMGFEPSLDVKTCQIGSRLVSEIRYVYHFD